MSAPYVCPLCGYFTQFGNTARITMHARISHGGQSPIVETRPFVYTGFECGAL